MLDWAIFSAANKRLPQIRVWTTKFLYNLLPTVTYTKTYTYDRPRCDHCPSQVDTWLHHLACPEPSRRLITNQFLSNTKKYLAECNTCPNLQTIILTGFRTAFLQQPATFSTHLPLFNLQAQIGWMNFFKGLWHKEWCLAQNTYLKETSQYTVSSTGTLWAVKLIIYFREQFHARWIEHTQAIHEPANRVSATKCRLLNRISYLQDQYSSCCPHHTHQFFINTQIHTYPLSTLQNWLLLHGPVVEKVLLFHRKTALLHQTLLTAYFR